MLDHLYRRPASRWLIAGLIIGLIGVVSFGVARYVSEPEFAIADDPRTSPITQPGELPWYWPLLEAEDRKPRPQRVLNGIEVGPNVDLSVPGCQRSTAAIVGGEIAYDSQFDPRPSYLPEGTVPADSRPQALSCDGTIGWAEAEFFVPPDSQSGRFGGVLIVFRSRQRAAVLDYADDRLTQVNIGSRPAVLISPLTGDGFGNSALLIREPFGLTLIHADGITAEELLKIGNSLVVVSGGQR